MRIKLLLLCIGFCLFQSFDVLGQAPVVKGGYCDTGGGGFDILPSYQACGSLSVTLENTVAGAANIGYVMDYDFSTGQKVFNQQNTHTYNKIGTYTILQVGSEPALFTLCKQVKVLENRKVNAKLEVFCNNILKVTVEEDEISKAYDHVEINWGDGQANSNWKSGTGIMTRGYAGSIPKISIQGKHEPSVTCGGEVRMLDPVTAENSVEKIQIGRVEMQEDGKISILYAGKEGVSTEIQYAEAGGNYLSSGIIKQLEQPGNSIIDKNLNPEQLYTVKLVSENCGGKKDSRAFSTMVIQAKAQESAIELTWNRYPFEASFVGYQLFRNDTPIRTFQSIDDISWSDKDLDCNKPYAYKIVALTDLGGSFSAPKSIQTTTSTPEKITKASVTVEDNNLVVADVILEGKGLTNTFNLIVERAALGSSDFKQVSGAQNKAIRFEDKGVNASGTSYCYRFSYENSCPLRSDFSAPVCTILLSQTSKSLTWSDASPFTEGLGLYDVMQTDANAGTAGIPVALNTFYELDMNNLLTSDYWFQIRARSQSGNLLSFSNLVRYDRKPVVFIPDAFTPNGDTHNDMLEVKGVFINSFKISVFNRWGQVVFRSDDMDESWDGKIKGEDAPAGYYTYKTEIVDVYDQPFAKSGTVLLIR